MTTVPFGGSECLYNCAYRITGVTRLWCLFSKGILMSVLRFKVKEKLVFSNFEGQKFLVCIQAVAEGALFLLFSVFTQDKQIQNRINLLLEFVCSSLTSESGRKLQKKVPLWQVTYCVWSVLSVIWSICFIQYFCGHWFKNTQTFHFKYLLHVTRHLQ